MSVAVHPFAIQDRTHEFRSCIASLSKINHSSGGSSRQGLLDNSKYAAVPAAQSGPNKSYKSEFALRASSISREIADTTAMLQRLALLAKRKTLFDDRPVEISQLTFVIKQKVSSINQSILSLQTFVKTSGTSGISGSGTAASAWGGGNSNKREKQLTEHANNVVVSLQGALTEVTTGFEEVLEVRIKNIQASKSRTEQFILSSAAASGKSAPGADAFNNFNNPDSPLYSVSTPGGGASTAGSQMPTPNAHSVHASKSHTPVSSAGPSISENPYSTNNSYGNGGNGDYLALPEQQQTLALLDEQQSDTYMAQRSNAVEAIESTIQELGGIFQQLATMVSEQREMIQRIDADTEDISLNVTGAQRELLKYYSRISSNRWLIMKSFGVILFFFLIWVLVS